MKLLLFAAAAALAVSGESLGDLKNVYVLPMANGLDQYLALRLTTGAVMQVVTDPQKADAVLTDRIGKSLEDKLDELYGRASKNESAYGTAMQGVRRSQGAIFLIDRKTRDVVWSDYQHPRNTTPDGLNHVAEKIVKQLEKDRKGK